MASLKRSSARLITTDAQVFYLATSPSFAFVGVSRLMRRTQSTLHADLRRRETAVDKDGNRTKMWRQSQIFAASNLLSATYVVMTQTTFLDLPWPIVWIFPRHSQAHP